MGALYKDFKIKILIINNGYNKKENFIIILYIVNRDN